MLAVIDSGGANITSVLAAFDRADTDYVFTSDADVIRSADKIVLPGVGAALDAMNTVQGHGLVDVIRGLTQPVIGICVGMQLLFRESEEGNVKTLGIFDAPVKRFPTKEGMAVPQMGWNNVSWRKDHPLLHNIPTNSYFYFANSYYAPVGDYTLGAGEYADDFTAIAARGNFMGWQFHPERSGPVGLQIIKNFLSLKPEDL